MLKMMIDLSKFESYDNKKYAKKNTKAKKNYHTIKQSSLHTIFNSVI